MSVLHNYLRDMPGLPWEWEWEWEWESYLSYGKSYGNPVGNPVGIPMGILWEIWPPSTTHEWGGPPPPHFSMLTFDFDIPRLRKMD